MGQSADMLPAQFLPPLGPSPKVLMVWPRVEPSFWGFDGMLELLPSDSLHPPLGLATVAALCPAAWTVRLVDLNLDPLTDADLAWADLVMVGGMNVQDEGMRTALARARALGKRSMVGGPYVSAGPEQWQSLADHVVVGEPDEMFSEIARDVERGTAQPRYDVVEKPDIRKSPTPRFELLEYRRYASMSVQVSRGCPYTCEFCDIITIYGRRPRIKPPSQVVAELDRLYALGWRGRVNIASDNFVADHRQALELAIELQSWQQAHGYPFQLSGEASMDLAQRPQLIAAMVKANFWGVFIGIESPSREALTETRKLQNLRQDPLEALRQIRGAGLWITGGFIVGFDSDTGDIFQRQHEFITRAAITWAMTGFLIALPTTPLHKRLEAEGRLVRRSRSNANFKPPNFQTVLPLAELLRGGQSLLRSLYEPDGFYDRGFRSIDEWGISPDQRVPKQSASFMLGVLLRSLVQQGLRSSYRTAYWRFLLKVLRSWRRNPVKLRQGITVLISGHHFIRYAESVVEDLEREIGRLAADPTDATAREVAA